MFEKPIKQKIFRGRKSRSGKSFHEKKLAGFLIAGVVSENEVGIGFSLCHKNDRWDFIKGLHQPGWGENLATIRAIKSVEKGEIEVPPSILKQALKFQERCERYYKGMQLPSIEEQVVEYDDFFAHIDRRHHRVEEE